MSPQIGEEYAFTRLVHLQRNQKILRARLSHEQARKIFLEALHEEGKKY